MTRTQMVSLTFSLLATFAHADQYDDLKTFASQVPHAQVDQEAFAYITNETNESTDGIKSHYTLALIENTRAKSSWYILDGYYQLKSGKILFLDFVYNPKTKAWRPVENYRPYLPGQAERFMLEAQEICNPFKRHFVGMLRIAGGATSLDKIQKTFEQKYPTQPLYLLNDGDLTIIDPTKSTRVSKKVTFTLSEQDLATAIKRETGLSPEIFPSGRQPSTPELKQTYAGSTTSCIK